jgi:hypothetical protein
MPAGTKWPLWTILYRHRRNNRDYAGKMPAVREGFLRH